MSLSLDPPLRPRRGVTLNVLGICRISTVHQDLHTLDDQEALLRRYIADHFDGPVSYRFLKSQASGEYVDRRELLDESGDYSFIALSNRMFRACRHL